MVTRTPGPFDYFSEKFKGGGTGDTIRAAADTPGTHADNVGKIADSLKGDEKKAVEATEGDIRDGVASNPSMAHSTATKLAANGQYGAACLRLFATDVDTFDTSVNTINVDYAANVKEGKQSPTHDSSQDGALKASAKHSLDPRYTTAEGQLDTDAKAVSSKIKAGPTDENVRDLIRAGLMPIEAASYFPTLKLTDDDKRAYNVAVLQAKLAKMTPEKQAEYLLEHPNTDPNVMLNIDDKVAAIMGKKLADKIRDMPNGWDTQSGDVKKLGALLQLWQDKSLKVTSELYKSLGPDDSLMLLAGLGSNVKARDDAADVASIFKRGLGLSDAMWDDKERSDFASGLVKSIEDPYQANEPDKVRGLSYLLYDGQYSDGFLKGVGDNLVNLDQQRGGNWNEAGTSAISSWFPKEHMSVAGDPMTMYMDALGNNSSAGRDFLNNDDHLKYVLHRNWGEGEDGYKMMGDAVDQAATDDPDKRSAHIVETLVADRGSNNTEMNDALQKPFGHIMHEWMGSAHNSMMADQDNLPKTPGVFTDDARFDKRDLDLFLADVSGDSSVHDDLIKTSNIYTVAELNQSLHGVTDVDDVERHVTDHVTVAGLINGAIDYGAGDTDINDKLEEYQKATDVQQGRLDFAKAVVGEIPTGKVPFTGYITDQIFGAIDDATKPTDHSPEAINTATKMYDGSRGTLEQLVHATIEHNMPSNLTPAQKEDWLEEISSRSSEAGSTYQTGWNTAQTTSKGH